MKVGIAGLGRMGGGMASTLMIKGWWYCGPYTSQQANLEDNMIITVASPSFWIGNNKFGKSARNTGFPEWTVKYYEGKHKMKENHKYAWVWKFSSFEPVKINFKRFFTHIVITEHVS